MSRFLLLLLAFFVPLAPAALGAESSGQGNSSSGQWRALAYQLPGGFRFIDRLDLTDEQQKALDKVYKDWMTHQREAYAAATKSLPPLSAEDQKDPQKVKDYYAKRSELIKAAQVPPPIDYVQDILSDEQLNKLAEANAVVESWNEWLGQHLAQYETRLTEILAPLPADVSPAKRFQYQVFEGMFKGASSLFSRLGLTETQETLLLELRKQYYSEYSAIMAPLGYATSGARMDLEQANAVRSAVSTRGSAELKEAYRTQVEKVLTPEQRERLAKALVIVEERDEAIWKRYSQYTSEISAILPPRPVQIQTTTAPTPGKPKKQDKTK